METLWKRYFLVYNKLIKIKITKSSPFQLVSIHKWSENPCQVCFSYTQKLTHCIV